MSTEITSLRDGWFIRDGEKIIQPMIYPPKGIKAALLERGLWQPDLRGKCENKCASNSCCNKRILELTEKSLVQETIEVAGHLCLFLPKFHCELNPIEYFGRMVKKCLREHCDYSFDGLKENQRESPVDLPKPLESVLIVQTIRRWENRVFRCLDLYSQMSIAISIRPYSTRVLDLAPNCLGIRQRGITDDDQAGSASLFGCDCFHVCAGTSVTIVGECNPNGV